MLYRAKRGFSLIELLVVIAIIAILAAILFPIFISTKESSKKAACQSNLKQIGAALSMYTSDNNDRYPKERACYVPLELLSVPNAVDLVAEPMIPGLVYSLRNYVKSPKIWQCPGGAKRTKTGNLAVYDEPLNVPVFGSGVWPLVVIVQGPGIRKTACNYTSWAFNRRMTDKELAGMRSDGYTEPANPTASHICNRETNARGKTPAEFINGIKHNFGEGGKIIPGPLKVNKIGQLLAEAYFPGITGNPYKPFYAHSRGQNILYYDGRVKWEADGRSLSD